MTSEKENARLKWWAIAALALTILMYVLPYSVLEVLVVRPDTPVLIRAAVAGTVLVVVVGFYLRMFFECAFGQGAHRRSWWLLLFIFVPIFSAFIYFFVTRSARYKERFRRGTH